MAISVKNVCELLNIPRSRVYAACKILDLQKTKKGFGPTGKTYDFSQEDLHKIKDLLEDQGIMRDLPEIEEDPDPAPDPSPSSEKAIVVQQLSKALTEYGPSEASVVYRYKKRRETGGYVDKGEHGKALSTLEVEELYGAGVYTIERREEGHVTHAWRNVQIGELEEEEEEEEEEELAPPVPEPGPPADSPAEMMRAMAEVQGKNWDMIKGSVGKQDPTITQIVAIFQGQADAEARRSKIRETEADQKHTRDLAQMKENNDAERERLTIFLAKMDENSKRLQEAVTASNERVSDANSKVMGMMTSSLNEQRDNVRDDRTRQLKDIEDLGKRIKDYGPGSPVYGLIQQGLVEARNVAGAVLNYKTGLPVQGVGAGAMGIPPASGLIPAPQAGGAGQAPPAAPDEAGIFAQMRASQELRDFMSMVSWSIEAGDDPANLGDAFMTQSFKDQTGRLSMVTNFFMGSEVPRIIQILNPPSEIRNILESTAGVTWWETFRARLKQTMDIIRGVAPEAANEPPAPAEPAGETDSDSAAGEEAARAPESPTAEELREALEVDRQESSSEEAVEVEKETG